MIKIVVLTLLFSLTTVATENILNAPVFTDSKLNKDIYQIKMTNSISKESFLNKCAELTVDNGYQFFAIVGSGTQQTYSLDVQNIDTPKKEISSTIKMFNSGSQPELSYEAKEVIKSFAKSSLLIAPVIEDKPKEQSDAVPKSKNTFLVGVNYNLATEIYSSDLAYGTGGNKYNGTFSSDFEKGFGINVSYLFSSIQDNLEIELGAFYDFPKNLKSAKFSLLGYNFTSTFNTSKISAYGAFGNAIYNFDKNYLLGGINTHKPELTGGSSSTSTTDSTSGGIGYQIGYGYKANDKIRLEIQYRLLQSSYESRADDNSYFSVINNAKIEGLLLQLRFGF